MGVPTSEVGYTSAMPRREDHEVNKDMWGIGQKKKLHNLRVRRHTYSLHARKAYRSEDMAPMILILNTTWR